MAGHGTVYCGGRGRHRYMPVEEGTQANNTTTTTVIKRVGVAALLMFSAALVGSSMKTSRAVSSSEDQRLREGTSAVSMNSNVVDLVS